MVEISDLYTDDGVTVYSSAVHIYHRIGEAIEGDINDIDYSLVEAMAAIKDNCDIFEAYRHIYVVEKRWVHLRDSLSTAVKEVGELRKALEYAVVAEQKARNAAQEKERAYQNSCSID